MDNSNTSPADQLNYELLNQENPRQEVKKLINHHHKATMDPFKHEHSYHLQYANVNQHVIMVEQQTNFSMYN